MMALPKGNSLLWPLAAMELIKRPCWPLFLSALSSEQNPSGPDEDSIQAIKPDAFTPSTFPEVHSNSGNAFSFSLPDLSRWQQSHSSSGFYNKPPAKSETFSVKRTKWGSLWCHCDCGCEETDRYNKSLLYLAVSSRVHYWINATWYIAMVFKSLSI